MTQGNDRLQGCACGNQLAVHVGQEEQHGFCRENDTHGNLGEKRKADEPRILFEARGGDTQQSGAQLD